MIEDALQRAFQSTRAVLEGVDPSSLDNPTPCQSWNVRELIDHIIGAPLWAVHALRGEETAESSNSHGDNFVAAYDASAAEVLTAFSEPGALEKIVKLPFAEVPGSFLKMMITTDQFTHCWDLARATGQSTVLDPELARALLAEAKIPSEFRGEEGVSPFGAERPAPEGASDADRLAAYLGRKA